MDRKEFSEYLRDFLSAYDDDAVEEVIKFHKSAMEGAIKC